MAGHLASKNPGTLVYNRTPGKQAHAVSRGAIIADSLLQIAEQCQFIALCLGGTHDVESVVAQLLPNCTPGTIIADHSTIEPAGARRIAERCQSQGVSFIDAPITGGSMGAQAGTLTIFCGGDYQAFLDAEPYLQAYGRRIAHVGESGKGQLTKLANQIAVGGALIGLCESMAFAHQAGLDLALTRELLSTGAAGSWAFENYGPKILNHNHTPGFSVKNQRKDFDYCLRAAAELGMTIPATALTDQLLAQLTLAGREEEATTALYDVLTKESP
jgi:3-hydroxyisobutyrate dehydrogenase-like beta-hydroxyacid dehydrogenase